MKGITHYTIGLAVASCFPEAVRQAAAGNPWPMLTGGFFALLPDLLDFKAIRFLSRRQVQIIPDPLEPNMQMVAEGLALAMRRARQHGRPLAIQLHPMRCSADEWHPYEVRFDAAGGIEARLLNPCTTDGVSLSKETIPEKTKSASVPLDFPLVIGYQARVRVATLEGPVLLLTPQGGRGVHVSFLPWHRQGSHSLGLAFLASIPLAIFGGLMLGAITLLALASHVIVDQLGYLGSSLLWPFRRRRYPGLMRFHADNSFANVTAVWLALLILFWNLARSASPPLPLSAPRLFFWAGFLPLSLITLIRRHFYAFPFRRRILR